MQTIMTLPQYVSWILSISICVIAIKRIKEDKNKLYLLLPIVFLMIHIFAFYTYQFLRTSGYFETTGISNQWSSIIRLHSLLTFLMYQINGYKQSEIIKSHVEKTTLNGED